MNNEKILSAIINNDFYFHPHLYEYICEHEGSIQELKISTVVDLQDKVCKRIK